jgi:cytoskeletal protein CcmA (bactofilin family)
MPLSKLMEKTAMTRVAIFSIAPLVAITCWLLPGMDTPLSAAAFRSGERLTVEAAETVQGDLYAFADEVTIEGKVEGDLVGFGRLIRINGRVEGDLIAAAQAIVITGAVGDDARIAGQVVKIDKEASVTGDVMAAGFSLEAVETSTVGGDPAGPQAYTGGWPPPVAVPSVPPGLTSRTDAPSIPPQSPLRWHCPAARPRWPNPSRPSLSWGPRAEHNTSHPLDREACPNGGPRPRISAWRLTNLEQRAASGAVRRSHRTRNRENSSRRISTF